MNSQHFNSSLFTAELHHSLLDSINVVRDAVRENKEEIRALNAIIVEYQAQHMRELKAYESRLSRLETKLQLLGVVSATALAAAMSSFFSFVRGLFS